MDTQQALQALGNCIAPANRAHALPPPFYVSPELQAIETDKIFRNGWVGLGRADRWCNAGDYSAMDVAGVPVIVVRGKDGVLAQSPTSGSFEIIDDDDLQAALEGAGSVSDNVDAAEFREESLLDRADTGDDELSLVSTQMLKTLLEIEDEEDVEEADSGFNPYDHG